MDVITDKYALYHGDCVEVMRSMKPGSVHLSIHSPPFAGLYQYSSDERDLSNSRTYVEFFEHYGYVLAELARVTMPGRIAAIHTMDVPTGNTGKDAMTDFPGDVVRAAQAHGLSYLGRHCIWKEPLTVRNRTLTKSLAHKTIVEDAVYASLASADYLLLFRNAGRNPVPVANPTGLTRYAGERRMPADLLPYRNWKGSQTGNKFSHWIWRQYASAFWDDIRLDRVLPYKPARDAEDEKHVHPLQLDVIDRVVTLKSNPGEIVLTPFMGVGSEVYGAVELGRRGIGIELKESYFNQAVKNLAEVTELSGDGDKGQVDMFG